MGESAGGGSVTHHITAFGGRDGPAQFSQPIPQSGAFALVASNLQQELTYQTFLNLLNVTTIEQARRLPYKALLDAITAQIAKSPFGTFSYGPVVDRAIVPALRGQLLANGQFDSTHKLLIGHTSNEGFNFCRSSCPERRSHRTVSAHQLP